MKKYLLTIAIVSIFAITGIAYANQSYFVSSFYLTGSSATTSPATIGNSGSTATQSFVIDSYDSSGNTSKFNEAYLLTQLAAATVSSTTALGVKVGITVQYSQDGVDYFTNNIATTTTANPVILGDAPQFVFSANVTSSSTLRSAVQIAVPTRYMKITYTGLTATSSVWAQLVPIKQVR